MYSAAEAFERAGRHMLSAGLTRLRGGLWRSPASGWNSWGDGARRWDWWHRSRNSIRYPSCVACDLELRVRRGVSENGLTGERAQGRYQQAGWKRAYHTGSYV